MATGKIKPGAALAASTFGLAGLAARDMMKKDKPKTPTNTQTFYPGG